MLDIRGLAKKLPISEAGSPGGSRNASAPFLFSRISATVRRSERIALIGKSGQGKSTLLRTLARFHTPDDGDMAWERTSFRQIDPRLWRQHICYLAQHPVMLPGSVEDNLRTVSRLHGSAYDLALAGRLLRAAGLGELNVKATAGELSGGEKQRVALIRSLMLRPTVLLLDEVTSSLDALSTRAVEQLLQQWHEQEGTALVWVTHAAEQAERACDRIWFMSGGTISEDATASDFFRRPGTEEARRFIGHAMAEETP
ncbi:MAG: ATP-binding cassette domain-containing protein [Paenibacillaceae bacterium]|nr:ATP-binding cassette domain-containing protein [Paenibacillaceae bacterium]